jgi:3'-phosphoadenosine 5'-phosphosulfate sulfotransferase (PAPS reductase)/FAD synthetase
MKSIDIDSNIAQLIDQNALFVINHSGGKDSQAMMIQLLKVIPKSQLLVVHASLGDIEWAGALELGQKQALDAGIPFIVAKSVKTFFEMVLHRFATNPDVPSWPSPKHRQCTSDLKRGPIQREVRRHLKEHGFSIIVDCVGIRAQESNARAKQDPFKRVNDQCNSLRTWYSWLPIFNWKTEDVFQTIKDGGQEPHRAYGLGNERLSCVFCIMASRNDLMNGAKHHPELLAKYIELEKKTGYTMHASMKPLAELVKAGKAIEIKSISQREFDFC